MPRASIICYGIFQPISILLESVQQADANEYNTCQHINIYINLHHSLCFFALIHWCSLFSELRNVFAVSASLQLFLLLSNTARKTTQTKNVQFVIVMVPYLLSWFKEEKKIFQKHEIHDWNSHDHVYLRFAQLLGSGKAKRLCANAIVAPIVSSVNVRSTDIL